jgi:hypothetical protein
MTLQTMKLSSYMKSLPHSAVPCYLDPNTSLPPSLPPTPSNQTKQLIPEPKFHTHKKQQPILCCILQNVLYYLQVEYQLVGWLVS